jgi:hypothetical protein
MRTHRQEIHTRQSQLSPQANLQEGDIQRWEGELMVLLKVELEPVGKVPEMVGRNSLYYQSMSDMALGTQNRKDTFLSIPKRFML